MKIPFLITATALLLSGCNNTTQVTNDNSEASTKGEVLGEVSTDDLSPLKTEEVFLKNKNPFGKDIDLKGRQIVGDTAIFSVKETELLIKGEQLIMKNLTNPVLYFLSFPELRLQKTTGRRGQAPDEFMYPTLVPSNTEGAVGYLFEPSLHKLYKIDQNGALERLEKPFLEKKSDDNYGPSMELANIGADDFMYVTDSKTGKSIFRITGDTTEEKEVVSLSLNVARKSPFAYIGSFAVNPRKNRMAYAYKYFKIIKFMDLEAKEIKTVNFERDDFKDETAYKVNGLDQNVTHYWGACAGDKYVYFLYSGRTPTEVMKEANKGDYYIFVEQYDWNGNPVKRYKLDQWGYFTVDEAHNKLYIVSANHDDPFFEFEMSNN